MGKYDNKDNISKYEALRFIANELAESNRLKRLELGYQLAHYGIDKDIISNGELEDNA